MSKKCVWVIETLSDRGWSPTIAARLTLIEAKEHLREWKRLYHCPDDRFRISKYLPQPEPGGK